MGNYHQVSANNFKILKLFKAVPTKSKLHHGLCRYFVANKPKTKRVNQWKTL